MGTRDLPDMYALSPRACGPQALGIHIRQITHAHVTTIKCKCAHLLATTNHQNIILSDKTACRFTLLKYYNGVIM